MSQQLLESLTSSILDPTYQPCITSRGPMKAKLLLIGEAPGETEEKRGVPFVGSSGRELERMMEEAGLDPSSAFMTNVFQTRPLGNKISTFFCLDKKQQSGILQHGATSAGMDPATERSSACLETIQVPYKTDGKQRYLHPNLLPELVRLNREIEECQPNLIIALGNTALWALTGRQNISSVRGTVLRDAYGFKILPTFHPAAVLRSWDLRPITIVDFMKAKRQMAFPEIRRPSREIWTNVSLEEIGAFVHQFLTEAEYIAVDVETRLGQITEISFSPDATHALVVPFIKNFKENYWNFQDEVMALAWVRHILKLPAIKIFQNGLYDVQYIWRTWGCAPKNFLDDTMLLQHSMYPEMQKGLGFLGSIHTDEPAWKLMRARGTTVEKRDDE